MKNAFRLSLLVTILLLPYFVFATTTGTIPMEKLNKVAPEAGYNAVDGTTIAKFVGQLIGIFISVLGIIFITLIIVAGFKYFMARGDDSKVSEALESIRRAIIGLIIILGSYAIWKFIFDQLSK